MADTKRPARANLTGPTISDVNQLLEKLLLKELPLKQNGIEISFEQPSREWSARLSGPTVNLFLYDCRRHKYQQAQWETRANGRTRAVQQRSPLRVDLHYLVTAWMIDGNPDEEHYLLTATLLALARHPRLPDPEFSPDDKPSIPEQSYIDQAFLPATLQEQPWPIPLVIADAEAALNPVEVWSVLDNNLRPSLLCRVTLALDPFQPVTLNLVGSRQLRFGQMATASTGRRGDTLATDSWPRAGQALYRLTGMFESHQPLEGVRLILVGRGIRGGGLYVPLLTNQGRTRHDFRIDQIPPGSYTLEVTARNCPLLSFDLAVDQPGKRDMQNGDVRLVVGIGKG